MVVARNFEEYYRREEFQIHPLLYSAGESRRDPLHKQTSNLKTPTNDKSGPHRFTSSEFEPQFQPIQTPKAKKTDSDIVVFF